MPIYQKPKTSKTRKGHKTYPYLLGGLRVHRPGQVWCADITDLTMRRGFLYLIAIKHWFARKVLAWRISNTLEADFCVEALNEAIHRFGAPGIMNADLGGQFTSFAWTDSLKRVGIRISMDGKGRCMHVTRVGGPFALRVVEGSVGTMRSAFFGIFAAATAQAILAAIAFWLADLPDVVLLTGLTLLAALVQVGPIISLILADAMLMIRGDHIAAVLVTIWFVVIVMSIDNLIKPYFARRGAALPVLLAFLGGAGGILAWGLIGAYLGPALMSVLYQLVLGWIGPEDRSQP